MHAWTARVYIGVQDLLTPIQTIRKDAAMRRKTLQMGWIKVGDYTSQSKSGLPSRAEGEVLL